MREPWPRASGTYVRSSRNAWATGDLDLGRAVSEILAHRVTPALYGRYFEAVLALRAGRDRDTVQLLREIPSSRPMSPSSRSFRSPTTRSARRSHASDAYSTSPAIHRNALHAASKEPRRRWWWGAACLNVERHRTPLDAARGLVHEAAHSCCSVSPPSTRWSTTRWTSVSTRPATRPAADGRRVPRDVCMRACVLRVRATPERDPNPHLTSGRRPRPSLTRRGATQLPQRLRDRARPRSTDAHRRAHPEHDGRLHARRRPRASQPRDTGPGCAGHSDRRSSRDLVSRTREMRRWRRPTRVRRRNWSATRARSARSRSARSPA